MLYIVGTSIGNIEDTSLRAVKTLTTSEILLLEDTASFDSYYKRIQELFDIHPTIKQQTVHFHKENEYEKLPWVIEKLKNDAVISLVSESGMPTISDPGYVLVKYLTSTNLPFTVIPGPTAFVTATVLSGFPTSQILYLGFLPKKRQEILRYIDILKFLSTKLKKLTIVFYESPHRIQATLSIIKEELPNSEVVIAREMTKKFEEIIRGKPIDLKEIHFKGELTITLKLNN